MSKVLVTQAERQRLRDERYEAAKNKKAKRDVNVAAKLLTKEYGASWPDRVDPNKIEMMSPNNCVIGQIIRGHDSYNNAKHNLYDRYPTMPRYVFSDHDEQWIEKVRELRAARILGV